MLKHQLQRYNERLCLRSEHSHYLPKLDIFKLWVCMNVCICLPDNKNQHSQNHANAQKIPVNLFGNHIWILGIAQKLCTSTHPLYSSLE
jgi:hypothetical protein